MAKLLAAVRPAATRLNRQFRTLLAKRSYNAAQSRALMSITPVAASRLSSPAAFFQEVHRQGRLLAKLNVPPAEAQETLGEFDEVTRSVLGGKHQPAWEQFQLATVLALNQAFFEVRECETRAFFGLYRAELEAKSLDDLLRRIVRTLTQTFRARSGRLLLMDRLPHSRLARPLYIGNRGSDERLILDEEMRGKHASVWSYPLRGSGVIQLGFDEQVRWLPRDLALLDAAAERCQEAIEYRRMEADRRQAEENERRRIGRELHDEAGQSLLCLRLELELMERQAPEPFRQRLRDARTTAEKTVEEVRRIISALSPSVLERLGLEAALRQLAARFQRTSGAEIRVRLAPGSSPLPMSSQQVIYRIAQESLQNAAKHSQATIVNLSFRQTDKNIRLSVSDNGAGFSVEAVGNKPLSFGLAGMRERAGLLGGTLAIRSSPGKGATVSLQLPQDAAGIKTNGQNSRTSD
jgi:signal transduction histidine kinase